MGNRLFILFAVVLIIQTVTLIVGVYNISNHLATMSDNVTKIEQRTQFLDRIHLPAFLDKQDDR